MSDHDEYGAELDDIVQQTSKNIEQSKESVPEAVKQAENPTGKKKSFLQNAVLTS